MSRMASESGYGGGGGGGPMEQHENMGFNPMDPDDEETIAWLMGPRSVDILKHGGGAQHSLYTASGGGGIARFILYIALLSLESMAPFIIMATALAGAALIVQGIVSTVFAFGGVSPSHALLDLIIDSPSEWSDWFILLLLLLIFAWGVAVQSKDYEKVLYRSNNLIASPRHTIEEQITCPVPQHRAPITPVATAATSSAGVGAVYHRLDDGG
ncbi:hypothetical protein Pmar_PMAR016420 [Perkinsus marinus ATCC 50983]|uniref:Uncharacterized protein n=1 Tax=Perkinsus marinus (strain ATCC 50983 / TXsc) TaxID=423536 RepID=C5L182_PERM5|nr:hypothetical protein Pmar_PMAR016420 [Perkinsus marinus ATCC 50983]EER09489.1 hypothetical protein Pmar_PMAR016420 [Perkinsus marinus ATCC 50983]|eukprot:XP_002777673.1 hypothetical protein Pmar_PMAR016420 [Perkinsus marinus ATCC 50983]